MIFSIFLKSCHLSQNSSKLQESISASKDFLLITSFQALKIKSSIETYFQFFLQFLIASIGQSQIHLIAFSQNLIVLSSM
jgi:hypothetical protein